jgi:hypothetical protein
VNLLAPTALAFGLSVPVLVLFYLLKVRRERREVPSLLLWEPMRRDLAARDPWQRLRWTILMALQLAALAALTFALARPAVERPAPANRFTALILDTSAGMRATDVAPRRFEAARAAARSVLNALPDGASAAIIAAGQAPRIVVPETTDRAALENGLDSLQATDAPGGSIDDALRMADALARGRTDTTIHMFSDGAYAAPAQWGEIADANLRYHPFGTDAGNRAVTAFSERPDPQGGAPQVFARIQNFSARPAQLTATLSADGKPIETRPLQLSANGSQSLVVTDVPADARVVQLRLDGTDAYGGDDQATLVRGTAPTIAVLLVSRGNLFLQKALESLPGFAVYEVSPRSYDAVDPSAYGIIVFDGYAPDQPPAKNSLLINPTDTPWLPLNGIVRNPPITLWRNDDPTLSYVDLRQVLIARASSLALPDWAHPVIESNGIPLGFVGTVNGQRIVGLSFDLQQSNLPLSSAFPIFVANVMRFLTPPSVALSPTLAPGDPAIITPQPGVDRVVVDGPNQESWTLTPKRGSLQFDGTDRTGLYRVTQYAGSNAVATEQFAVNLFSPDASDLRPRANLTDRNAPPAPAGTAKLPMIHEYAPWLLLLVIPLMLGEWWWFHRR